MALTTDFLISFLKQIKVPFTKNYALSLSSEITSNNNLLTLTKVLKEHYNIDSIGIRIKKEDILKLDTPFIAHINYSSWPFVTVTNITNNSISYLIQGTSITEQLNTFTTKWNGTVLITEKSNLSREITYRKNQLKDILKVIRLPFVMLFCIIVLVYNSNRLLLFNLKSLSIQYSIAFFYFVGSGISIILLSQVIDKSGGIAKKVCSISGFNGCEKILEGEASTFMGLISWSEIGFVYFCGSLLSILLVPKSLSILFILSLLALTYTIWSIHYQWKIARQWCILCLSIQTTLWILAIVHVINNPHFLLTVNTNSILFTLLCFASPMILLWLLIPYAKSSSQFAKINEDFKGMKYREDIFTATLKLTKPVKTDASNIILGDKTSSFLLTMVTDPYCKHCAKAHKHIKDLLRLHTKKIKIQLVFRAGNYISGADKHLNDLIAEKNGVIEYLIGVYKVYGAEKAEDLYNKWYDLKSDRDSRAFLADKALPPNIDGVKEEFFSHLEWCDHLKINGTPTFFVNGYALPKWYDVSDIRRFI